MVTSTDELTVWNRPSWATRDSVTGSAPRMSSRLVLRRGLAWPARRYPTATPAMCSHRPAARMGVAASGAVHRPGSALRGKPAVSTIHHKDRRWVEEEMR